MWLHMRHQGKTWIRFSSHTINADVIIPCRQVVKYVSRSRSRPRQVSHFSVMISLRYAISRRNANGNGLRQNMLVFRRKWELIWRSLFEWVHARHFWSKEMGAVNEYGQERPAPRVLFCEVENVCFQLRCYQLLCGVGEWSVKVSKCKRQGLKARNVKSTYSLLLSTSRKSLINTLIDILWSILANSLDDD
jgi:hypothetical protein